MATTFQTTLSLSGREVSGLPLATDIRTTPLRVTLNYNDTDHGVNMVWSASEANSPGAAVILDLSALVDDRGTVTFTQVHGYTFNIRSGDIEFYKAADVAGAAFYRYMPISGDSSTAKWRITGPGQLTFTSAAAAGDAITGTTNKSFTFWPSTGADYDVVIYGVGTIT